MVAAWLLKALSQPVARPAHDLHTPAIDDLAARQTHSLRHDLEDHQRRLSELDAKLGEFKSRVDEGESEMNYARTAVSELRMSQQECERRVIENARDLGGVLSSEARLAEDVARLCV